MYKDIIYNGKKTNYQVDEFGCVKSLFSNKILKPNLKKTGCYEYCLYVGKKKINVLAHHLVANAFINNPNDYKSINHIDGNKTNNSVDNLEWCSYSDNMKHAWDTGLNNSTSVDKSVIQYTLDGEFIKEYKNCAEATRETGIKHVHCAAKGARNSAGGYIWKFKYEQPIKDTGYKKPVVQYDLLNNEIAKYESISDAARKTKINRKGINDCCNGKLKTSGGYIWKFL